jgi:septal ring-binding cell division protein DamX
VAGGRELWPGETASPAGTVSEEPAAAKYVADSPPVPSAVEKPWDGVERRGRAVDPMDESALASALEEEVRTGRVSVRPIRRSPAGLIGGVVAGLAVAASVVAIVTRTPSLPPGKEVLPAGNEQVLSAPDRPLEAGLGNTPSVLPSGGAIAPAPSVSTAPPAASQGAPAVERAEPAPVAATGAGVAIPAGLRPSAPSAGKPFRVHVASFRSLEKVEAIAASLQRRGAEAWIEKAENAPGYYRVFVGRFATEAEARTHAQWLLTQGWVDRAQAYPLTER